MIWKLLVVLVVLGAIVVLGAELLAPPLVEQEIEARVEDRLTVGSVDAELSGLPIVARVLTSGEVRTVTVTLTRLAETELVIDRVRVRLDGVVLERSALIDGDAQLREVESGTLEAEVAETDIQNLVPAGADVQLEPGQVVVTAVGQTISADAAVADGQLQISLGPLPTIGVDLPRELLECDLDARVEQDRVSLRCNLDQVPSWMIRRANDEL